MNREAANGPLGLSIRAFLTALPAMHVDSRDDGPSVAIYRDHVSAAGLDHRIVAAWVGQRGGREELTYTRPPISPHTGHRPPMHPRHYYLIPTTALLPKTVETQS
jgi:hypothetical protein